MESASSGAVAPGFRIRIEAVEERIRLAGKQRLEVQALPQQGRVRGSRSRTARPSFIWGRRPARMVRPSSARERM